MMRFGHSRRRAPTVDQTSVSKGLMANTEGVVSIEFALLGTLFMMAIAGVLQAFIINAMSMNLEVSLQRSARILYTGQFQNASAAVKDMSSKMDMLKQTMCGSESYAIFNCDDLRIQISSGSSFSSSAVPSPLDETTGGWKKDFGATYKCAGAGAIVVVTAAVRQPLPMPYLALGLPAFADGTRLLQSTTVFRTEPYAAQGSQC